MAGSGIGTIFRITTWGETHGKGLGVVIDGCPAGVPLEEADIQLLMDRRRPGQSRYTTQRQEKDQVEILSGVFEGKTTGTPVSLMVFNKDQRSGDYNAIKDVYRPGHGDYTYDMKYGFRDYRGGGRSSGRETIGRVAAGAVAQKCLSELGISFCTYAKEIGGISIKSFDAKEIARNPFYMPDKAAARQVDAYADKILREQDSLGGVIECVIDGVPAGIGEPVFEKLNARLGQAVLSIGAVKGFEIGDGFAAARAKGSQNNDIFKKGKAGTVIKETNHAGGVLGGISDGSQIVLRAAVKPTPSIGQMQKTVNNRGETQDLTIEGRHDPMIVPRAVVVVESMAAVTLLDCILMGMGATIEKVKDRYHV